LESSPDVKYEEDQKDDRDPDDKQSPRSRGEPVRVENDSEEGGDNESEKCEEYASLVFPEHTNLLLLEIDGGQLWLLARRLVRLSHARRPTFFPNRLQESN